MQPLYRRGPMFHAPPVYDSQWPMQHHYGPPDDRMRSQRDLSRAFDYELFSLYFLLAESLSTYVGYRITQHCLRGCRVTFLSPAQRMLIGVLYCSMKIKLIDYTFHGSAYYTISLLVMIWYFANAVVAVGFHFGPLQFLFYDYIPRSKTTRSLFQRVAALCGAISTRAELYVLQHVACMPPPTRSSSTRQDVDTSGLQLMAEKSEPASAAAADGSSNSSGSAATLIAPGCSRLALVFGRVVDVQIAIWNASLIHQWRPTLETCSRSAAVRVRDVLDVFECRFLFVMQPDGLLLGFFMATPTATTVTKLRTGCATPFELILRFHTQCESAHHIAASDKPLYLYAESPSLVGPASQAQKTYIFALLQALNAAHGRCIDVSLRSLRCKNFVAAGTGQIVTKRPKARSIGNTFEQAFG